MNPRQYMPFNMTIDGLKLIVYPVKDENPLNEVRSISSVRRIKKHLKELYEAQPQLNREGDYHILFIWNLEGAPMTDVWTFRLENFSDSGPLVNCYTFCDLEEVDDAGIASGDHLIVLGVEEELRRGVSTLGEYLDRPKLMPEFPEGLQPSSKLKY